MTTLAKILAVAATLAATANSAFAGYYESHRPFHEYFHNAYYNPSIYGYGWYGWGHYAFGRGYSRFEFGGHDRRR
jgi:hypothetical protein